MAVRHRRNEIPTAQNDKSISMKPSFIIFGGVKCATSSMYRYLNGHPNVLPCKTKEPEYFNNSKWYHLLARYYRYLNLYPKLGNSWAEADWLDIGKDERMVPSSFKKKIEKGINYITGEATASSMVRANPKHIKRLFPKMKAILLVRQPSERYMSHFNMFMRFKKEGRKGYDLGAVDEFIQKEIKQFENKERTKILDYGAYMKYLPEWKKCFGKDLLVLKSEALNELETARGVMTEMCQFLSLEDHDFSSILQKKFNKAPTQSQQPQAAALLDEFYAPWNDALSKNYNIQY